LEKAEVKGPYINFYLNYEVFAEKILLKIFKENKKFGYQNIGNKKVIAMDYSHPNIAKPFGIGHLRSTVIGNSLYKVFTALGYKPVSLNYLGDWGTQFGKLIVAFNKWGNKKELNTEPIKYLLKLYVKFHEEAEKDESLNDLAREEFKKLEDGNKESLALWKLFKDLSLKEFMRIYKIIGVSFDSFDGEAFINKFVPKAIDGIKSKVKTEISDEALIVDLKKYDLPPVILLKSDGATTYHSRDAAAIFYRLKKFKADKILYIVGSEQKMHFQQLFKLMELMGFEKEKFVHADFGLFRFPEGKMSTRKGNVIFLDEVLSKSIGLAEKIIEEKNPNLKNKKETARMVGVGAIIFGDLSNDRVKDIDFVWEKMISFEGDTAPYIQYTHARACSILKKAKIKIDAKIDFGLFKSKEEMKLISLLSNFPEILIKVGDSYKPHILANYLISLSQAFNEFYQTCPVISDQKQLMKSRVILVECSRQTIENGLKLLGIMAPTEM
ncbi:MAG: arginine--tRNA ligase, partial [archaeon]|nr:arginine--tRNA ligase [archaeon]